MKMSENAQMVLERYVFSRTEDGKITEDWAAVAKRVGTFVASKEPSGERGAIAENFTSLIEQKVFVPNSPTLVNAGFPGGQLAACFVLPIKDSIDGIFDTLKEAAMVHKSGGGSGYNWNLRPKGAYIGGTRRTSDGNIGFITIYDTATQYIKQGGCFVGNTLIGTPGGPVKIKDVKEGQLVYSYDTKANKVCLARATGSWITKNNAEVWKLTTDKGLVIYATPDHPIVCRDGKFRKLADLQPGRRLMPLSRCVKRGEWSVHLQDGNDTRVLEHRLVGEYLFGNICDLAIHHKDGNHLNNHENNLEALSNSEHATFHGKKRGAFFAEGLFGEKNGMHIDGKFWKSSNEEKLKKYKHAIGKAARDNNPMKNKDIAASHPLFNRESTKMAAKRGRVIAVACSLKEKGLSIAECDWSTSVQEFQRPLRYRKETVLEHFATWDDFVQEVGTRNHVVESVEFSHYEDVYNMEVPGPHTYCVVTEDNKGVFVSNTRRGANLGTMYVDHPDIEDFIMAKTEEGAVENFNLSVLVTDKFMELVKAKRFEDDWDLQWGGKVYRKVKVGQLWNLICSSAWSMGDPGVLFFDTINAANPTPHLGKIESTNPCLTGETLVMTKYGNVPMKDLVGKEVTIYSQGQEVVVNSFRQTSEAAAVYRIQLTDGRSVDATAYHAWPLENGTKVTTIELQEGMTLVKTHACGKDPIVQSVRLLDFHQPVYCCTVPGTHTFALGIGIETSNCGESPLLPYESCILGSLNLSKFVQGSTFKWKELTAAIHTGVRFLDDVIDVNVYPIQEIKKTVLKTRKVGLGIMGFADILIMLKIPYGSQQSLDFAEKLMGHISKESRIASEELAVSRGAFPEYQESWEGKKLFSKPLRNATRTSIAPTGTISIIAGCSSGIEPLYSLAYLQDRMGNKRIVVQDIVVESMATMFGPEKLTSMVEECGEDVAKLNVQLKAILPDYFVTADQVPFEKHVEMQARFQKHVDLAVSKTINLPNSATKEQIATIYELAHTLGCKGITIYRDGSRKTQVLSKESKSDDTFTVGDRLEIQRPEILTGKTYQLRLEQDGKVVKNYLTVNTYEGRPYEIFFIRHPKDKTEHTMQDTVTRCVSMMLRHGIPAKKVVEQLEKSEGTYMFALPHSIAKVLRDFIPVSDAEICPTCKSPVIYQSGCKTCACGASASKCN